MKFSFDVPNRQLFTLIGLLLLFFVPNLLAQTFLNYDTITVVKGNYDAYFLGSFIILISLIPLIVFFIYLGFLYGISYRKDWEARQ